MERYVPPARATRFTRCRLLTVLLVMLALPGVHAQSARHVDTLPAGIPVAGEARVDALNKLAKQLLDTNYEAALQYATLALESSVPLGYKEGSLEARYTIANINVNYALNYKEGLTHLGEALELARATGNVKKEMESLRLIGYVHNRQENVASARYYYDRAIAVAKKNGFTSDYARLNSYMGDLLERNGDTTAALMYYERVLVLAKQDTAAIPPDAKLAIGRYHFLRGEHAQAVAVYEEALQDFEKSQNHRWEAYMYCVLGELYLATGDPARAIEEGQKGLAVASKFHLVKEIADNHYILAAAYDSAGNYKMAYHHFRLFSAINDSVFTIDRAKQIASVQASLETALQAQELEKVKQEKAMNDLALEKNRSILFVLVAGIAVLCVLLVYIVRRYRQKQRVNKALRDRDELRQLKLDEIIIWLNEEIAQHRKTQSRLETANTELNNFMYRSSHDLKGPIASIIGITNLAKKEMGEDVYIRMITECATRLNTTLDDLLGTTRVTSGIMRITAVNVEELAQQVVHDLRNADYAAKVRIQVEIEKELVLHTDDISFRAILQNLVDNSLKYKDPAKPESWIKIAAAAKENGVYLEVADNGQGIEKDQQPKVFGMFVRSSFNSRGSGLGLYIVKKSIEKLGGKIELESAMGVGTTFRIFLPDKVNEVVPELSPN
jgi:signal transduction histidine kinase